MNRLAVLAPLVLSGCSLFQSDPCAVGLKPSRVAELYFGRNVGTSEGVSDAAWQDFVAHEIAPRFPYGFSVRDSSGQWRGPNGAVIAERSKVVTVVGVEDETKLSAIRSAYRARFHQDSVLQVETQACAAF